MPTTPAHWGTGRPGDKVARDEHFLSDGGQRSRRGRVPVAELVGVLACVLEHRRPVALNVSEPPLEAVTGLVAREDRTPERRVFQGFGADKFRTALTRACTASGVPMFSPHDLRHRRVSLLHLAGMPWARIGELVGHGDIVTTARTYTLVVADEDELDYAALVS